MVERQYYDQLPSLNTSYQGFNLMIQFTTLVLIIIYTQSTAWGNYCNYIPMHVDDLLATATHINYMKNLLGQSTINKLHVELLRLLTTITWRINVG